MAKIERFNGNVMAFAINNQPGEKFLFGSSTTDSDNLTDQLTSEFLRGFATVGPSEFPPLEWFNAATFTSTQFISYLHQMGVAEWNAAQEYPTQGGMVIHNGRAWKRGASWSTGDEPGVSSSWSELIDSDSIGNFVQVENRFKGNQNWNVEGNTGDPLPSATPTLYTVGSEIAAGRFCVGANLVNCTFTGGLFDADSGSYYIEYDGDFTSDFFGIKLADNKVVQTGCSISFVGGKTRVTVDMSVAPAHKFAGFSERAGAWPDVNDTDSLIAATGSLGLNFSVTGYQIFESGMILQWARWSKPAGSSASITVNLPIPAPNGQLAVWSSGENAVFPQNVTASGNAQVIAGAFTTPANTGAGTVYSIGF